MKKLTFVLFVLFNFSCVESQNKEIDQKKIKEDLNEILTDISQNYIYLKDKKIDLDCIREYYEKQISNIKTEEHTILFFEYLLDEFYDSHITLNTNRNSSFRLFSPIYTILENGKFLVSNVWQTQIEKLNQNIVGTEIIKFNGINFEQVIKEFPTHCNNKNSLKVKEWIANKILSGRYNQPRILTLKFKNGETFKFNLDNVKFRNNNSLLTSKIINEIGIIRINNSLGNNLLISEFDKTLDSVMNTKGLIIDLRNTVGGGNSYVAKGIMSRFINSELPYQKHVVFDESWDNQPKIGRSWVEYVSPRNKQYKNPVVILVGRWTGSMGEGLAIGFEGMERAQIVGSEMQQLAGAIFNFGLNNQKFGYQLSMEKLFHINGTAREKYVPTNYIKQTTTVKDETLEKGIELIRKMTK
ncbi:S41 family peptidase [Lutibacter citreus]|uniref:S41 family peptidase n=1 Tax=Lutibacter citreus TaxID=2138210 RepID=UPI000DBE466B|nr:S41 family peptidase [Lutibacter citreus]